MTQSAAGTVAVLGSINMDVVLQVPRFPAPGETILSTAAARHPGGKGANQAIAAARAGAVVRMIGAVGDDADGRAMLSLLNADGVDCSSVTIGSKKPTGAAYILVDEVGENQITVSPGANATASATFEATENVLLAQLELPLDTVASFLSARRSGSIAILNAAPFHPGAHPLLTLADVLVVNEIELVRYRGERALPTSVSEAIDMARRLVSYPGQTVVVTRGKAGSVTVGPEGELVTPAPVAEAVVDTIGAGDCFCGYFAAQVAAGQQITLSLEIAHRAAALSVGRSGAASSIPSLADLRSKGQLLGMLAAFKR